MRLGLFGGTFDPVHFGHLLLAECAREQCRLDEVRFLPAAVPPHKQQRELTPGAARAEMLELAIGVFQEETGHERFSVSRHEIDRGGVSYTVETLAHFHQAHFHEEDPDGRLFFLLGADMLLDLPRWREPERVCRLAVPITVQRPGAAQLDFGCLEGIASPERIETIRRHQVEMPRIDLASSDIRRRVAAGLSIRYRTPRAVEKYIEAHGLYR